MGCFIDGPFWAWDICALGRFMMGHFVVHRFEFGPIRDEAFFMYIGWSPSKLHHMQTERMHADYHAGLSSGRLFTMQAEHHKCWSPWRLLLYQRNSDGELRAHMWYVLCYWTYKTGTMYTPFGWQRNFRRGSLTCT
jgi:hypothetical protein